MRDTDTCGQFHPFPQLPAEIRDYIWSLCLPRRVRELDEFFVYSFYHRPPVPCKRMWRTTQRNNLPPLISQVCRDSRAVALKSRVEGPTFPAQDEAHPAFWAASSEYRSGPTWKDKARDSPHLNWMPANRADVSSRGNPLGRLEWETSRASGHGSFMLQMLQGRRDYAPNPTRGGLSGQLKRPRPAPSAQQILDRETLLRMPKWQVVLKVIVVHTTRAEATASGLFGLCGEEVVQIVDAADGMRCDRYYQHAEAAEKHIPNGVTAPQDYTREPLAVMQRRVRDCMMLSFDCEQLAERAHPAIMFRLCTYACHKRELTESDDEDAFW